MDAIATREMPRTSPPATEVAHAWIRAPIYHELAFIADRKRIHVDAYTAQILTAVVLLGLADELIDRAVASLPR